MGGMFQTVPAPWKGRAPGKSLELAAAWRVENPGLWKTYTGSREQVAAELAALKADQMKLDPGDQVKLDLLVR